MASQAKVKSVVVKNIQVHVLSAYKKVFGHLFVPPNYVVPNNVTLWPKEFHNYRLGQHVTDILNHYDRIKIKSTYKRKDLIKLQELGFIAGHANYRAALYLDAFKRYKEKFNSTVMQESFEICEGDGDFLEASWGVKLGSVLNNIIENKDYKSIHNELKHLGYIISSGHSKHNTYSDDSQYFHHVCLAIKTYADIHGNVDIAPTFKVPTEDAQYPEEVRGMALGVIVKNLRKTQDSLDMTLRRKLEALNVIEKSATNGTDDNDNNDNDNSDSNENRSNMENSKCGVTLGRAPISNKVQSKGRRTFSVTLLAFQTYKEQHGNLDIPKSFVISTEDSNYPEHVRGFALGKSLFSIMEGKTYAAPKYLEKLNGIGIFPPVKPSTPIFSPVVEVD